MKPWKLLDTSLLLSKPPWVEVFRETVELPSGKVMDDFYRVITPEFAVIVAVTPDGQLLTTRSYRHGPKRICLVVPAGLIEPGEPPLVAAQRELLEETGYEAMEWTSLGSFVVDSNRQCGTAHIFLASHAVPKTSAKPDETEELEIELMSPRQFLRSIANNETSTLASVSAVALAIANGLREPDDALSNKSLI
jgi:ADP-ribose pyrophosphatase